MCGEKFTALSSVSIQTGSPPRVRGKGAAAGARSQNYGITPACAGKRPTVAVIDGTGRDHPRVCGEKHSSSFLQGEGEGSPPRVRGKDAASAACPRHLRITPACAGKRMFFMRNPPEREDHPRVCGEKCFRQAAVSGQAGSPPRVRGKAVFPLSRIAYNRITPACAGKRLKKALKNKDF